MSDTGDLITTAKVLVLALAMLFVVLLIVPTLTPAFDKSPDVMVLVPRIEAVLLAIFMVNVGFYARKIDTKPFNKLVLDCLGKAIVGSVIISLLAPFIRM